MRRYRESTRVRGEVDQRRSGVGHCSLDGRTYVCGLLDPFPVKPDRPGHRPEVGVLHVSAPPLVPGHHHLGAHHPRVELLNTISVTGMSGGHRCEGGTAIELRIIDHCNAANLDLQLAVLVGGGAL